MNLYVNLHSLYLYSHENACSKINLRKLLDSIGLTFDKMYGYVEQSPRQEKFIEVLERMGFLLTTKDRSLCKYVNFDVEIAVDMMLDASDVVLVTCSNQMFPILRARTLYERKTIVWCRQPGYYDDVAETHIIGDDCYGTVSPTKRLDMSSNSSGNGTASTG